MRKKRVWRYYCEYCKKSGCSGGHMKNHEESCTNNPNRRCGMCAHTNEIQKPMSILIAALGDGKSIDTLRDVARGCPACMLAAIRQSGLQYYEFDEDGDYGNYISEFDYKKEKERFWGEINDRLAMEQDQYLIY